jgi:hypothetical protein
MTTLQKASVAALLCTAVGIGIYEARRASRFCDQAQLLQRVLQQQQASLSEKIEQLASERDDALKQLSSLSAKPTPRLPAPPIQAAMPAADDSTPTNLYSRFNGKQPKLTAEQIAGYLKANGRSAASLLAAYRTTGDPAFLAEAVQNYPADPKVAFEAAFKKDVSPQERQQWLETFQKSDPGNSLPNYLMAADYLRSGQTDRAVEELIAASAKPEFADYTRERMQDGEEAYLAAGYSVAEAKTIPSSQLLLPQLQQIKDVGLALVDLAKSYQQVGDDTSAQAALQMAAGLGQRYKSEPGETEISWLVGMAVERTALRAMDPNRAYGNDGQTVQGRLDQIAAKQTDLKALGAQFEPLLPRMSDQDWISYKDRWRAFGEESAIRWVVNKLGGSGR